MTTYSDVDKRKDKLLAVKAWSMGRAIVHSYDKQEAINLLEYLLKTRPKGESNRLAILFFLILATVNQEKENMHRAYIKMAESEAAKINSKATRYYQKISESSELKRLYEPKPEENRRPTLMDMKAVDMQEMDLNACETNFLNNKRLANLLANPELCKQSLASSPENNDN